VEYNPGVLTLSWLGCKFLFTVWQSHPP
jgi:hypothetical protein